MIDTVIFDLGKVLVEFDIEGYLKTLSYDTQTIQALLNAFHKNDVWFQGDSGLLSTEAWVQLFIDNEPNYENEIKKVFANIGKSIYPREYTLDWIKSLKERGYHLFYLSNYPEEIYNQTKKQLSFIETFDGGIFSFQEKCMKPDRRIYELLIERYQIDIDKAIFYDDKKENVEVAKSLGIRGEIFTPEVAIRDIKRHTWDN
ncbi:HAD family hydrolase [Lachnospiraceae bacterium LCP25S3_G4]